MSDLSDLSDLSDKLGRHDIPRGFAVPQSGMARVQSYRGGMRRSALPQGKTKKNPAARLEESAAVPTGKFVRDF